MEPMLHREDIIQYLSELGSELAAQSLTGEIVLAGGAVMLLVLKNRAITKDIDAYLAPPTAPLRAAARTVAARHGLRADWLNDGVKGFFYGTPPQDLLMEIPGLRVYTVTPPYLLVMKAMAARPEDVDDVTALIAHLGITHVDEAMALIQQYVPPRLVGPHVRYFLEDLLGDGFE